MSSVAPTADNLFRFGHAPVFDDPEKQIGRTAGEVRELLMGIADDPDTGRINADGYFEMCRPANVGPERQS